MRKYSFIVLAFIMSLPINAQYSIPSATIPKRADVSINGITLNSRETAEKILGKDIPLVEKEGLPSASYYNKSRTEVLTIVLHHGATKNSFSEFRVRKAYLKEDIKIHQLNPLDNFVTGKGIRLGMSSTEVIKILGRECSEYVYIGNVYSLRYEIMNRDNSCNGQVEKDFVNTINQYYSEYRFEDGLLVEFAFGYLYS